MDTSGHDDTGHFQHKVLGVSMFMTSSSQQPTEQSQRWAGPNAQFSALSECDSDDLELPLAPVCKYVTIMIRIDDRTL